MTEKKLNNGSLDLTGLRFDRWTVVSFYELSKPKYRQWNCVCDCGTTKIVGGSNLRGGVSRSCGCLKNELFKSRSTTHGKSKTSEYQSWASMIQRCTNSNHPDFGDYGGRGILVCDRWRDSFENFYADMGDKPKPAQKYSIERIDHERGYYQDNCEWISKSLQPSNTRRSNLITWNGETLCVSKWAEKTGIDYHTLQSRIHKLKMVPPELFKPTKKFGNGADHRSRIFVKKNNAVRSKELRDRRKRHEDFK